MELLVITGPIGSGKTRILEAITEQLRAHDIAHVGIDMDALCSYWPWIHGDVHNRVAGTTALKTMIQTARERAIARIVLTETLSQPQDLEPHLDAIAPNRTTIARLTLDADTLRNRITNRRRDGNLNDEVRGALAQNAQMEATGVGDFVIQNNEDPLTVAGRILRELSWIE